MKGAIKDGAGFAGFAASFDLSPADGDMIAKPDMSSCIVLPWKKEVAWVASDLYLNGVAFEQSPRLVLKKQMAKAAAGYGSGGKQLVMKTGVECEWMFLDASAPRTTAGLKISDPKDLAPKPCYDSTALMRRFDVITEMMDAMESLGWGPYQADHEDANGQFELNWEYADALTTADRHTFFKFMLRSVSEKHGLAVTMMPKPFMDKTGNGCHLHITLHDEGEDAAGANIFADGSNDDPLGLSDVAKNFLGGIIEHGQALTALGCPTVNSYKRLGVSARTPESGATWAPTVLSHGGNDRTHMIRVPGAPRYELRLGDMAANPYLYPAYILAAGLDGMETKADPGPRCNGPAWTLDPATAAKAGIPGSLTEALDALEADTVLTEAAGAEVSKGFLKLRREQWRSYASHLTQWELDEYLDV